MSQLRQLSHTGPSVCVKFHGKYVLAGYGVFVHVYNYESGELVSISRVFHRNKVHGLAIREKSVLLYGGRSVSLLDIDYLWGNADNTRFEKLCHEWVVSGEHSMDGSSVFLLTSYNKVLCCDLSFRVLQTKAVYGERSILYSGTITVLNQDKVLVNAGTVMDGVLVWDLKTEKTIHHFTDHEGSIFYVAASIKGRYAASCSDDRSIKLWDLHSGHLVSTGWGHTARIWNLKFYDNDSKLISVSEDCTCRVWEISERGTLIQKSIHELHQTKSIWGVDVNDEKMIAVTSGNDGRIKITDLNARTKSDSDSRIFSLDDISKHGVKLRPNEIIKGFYWLRFGLLAMTSEGQVLKFDQKAEMWTSVMTDSRFTSYSATSGVQEFDMVIFSNSRCELLILKFSEDGNEILENKQLQINELTKSTNCLVRGYNSKLFLVMESPNPKDPFFCLRMDASNLQHEERLYFKKPKNFTASSFAFYENFAIFGSRFSTLAIFDLENCEREATVLRKILPGDTITSIDFVEKNSESDCLFSVSDRDGFYCFISINFLKRSHKVLLQNRIPKGFLEGAHYNAQGDFITYGFKSNLFYVFNETKQYEVFSELCGGAHRQWRYLPNFGLDEFIFIYIKASSINFRKIHKAAYPEILRNGLHGREIRDLCVRTEPLHLGKTVFCSASEDTTIKLNVLNVKDGETKTVWTFRKHTSGLQRCKFINNKFMISSAAREELYLWELTDTFMSNPYMTIICALPSSSEIPDLRIMDFACKAIEGTEDFILTTVYSDSAIKVWLYSSDENTFKLLISDKYQTCCLLNVALVTLDTELILVVSPTDGHLVCWNLTKYIPYVIQNNKLVKVLEGFQPQIHLPDISERIAVHSAGIKSFEFKIIAENRFFVYTGGDDNAVAISEFVLDKSHKTIQGCVRSFISAGAASTITSVKLIRRDMTLLTASVDQVVRYYDVSAGDLVLKNKFYTTNADTGCIDTLSSATGSIALIGGVGFSVWTLE
ncbi:tRNA (34-2'-O)-methyltransferase regulator RTT10 [Lachancea thermotolerans CBS 6340]|uniref:KLTH0H05038p n=1 Tax=Lachancea thermotolerans (strain ATCC 56472 / CBS 6340 / NRRL Y-8284) TaxID=559295 RepID=C5E2H7_LACTC|nr:KLTH0H05038p [Lachancea thermotolerans CBS 6340]CAR30238.1 KLTH0H05038p [Lachancea thermotolerans CBS 6340]